MFNANFAMFNQNIKSWAINEFIFQNVPAFQQQQLVSASSF